MGAGVAFINPMMGAQAMYKNIREQGEHVGHTGMLAIANTLFLKQQAELIDPMPNQHLHFAVIL